MNTQETISQLQGFRQELYQLLPARRDALLDLLDALSSSLQAHSVVELSLSPLFRRGYSGIQNSAQATAWRLQGLATPWYVDETGEVVLLEDQ